MSNNTFAKIKKSTLFKKADLLIYLLVALIIAVTILSFVLFNKKYATGFYVSVKGETFLSYDFETDKYTISQDKSGFIETKLDGEFIRFTITLENGDYNVIAVNKVDKSAYIEDANCPHKDCVSFSPISLGKKNTLIYCSVHDLRIISDGESFYVPPATGELK